MSLSSSSNRMIALWRNSCRKFISISSSGSGNNIFYNHDNDSTGRRSYSKKRLSKQEIESLQATQKSLEEIEMQQASLDVEAMDLSPSKRDYSPIDITDDMIRDVLSDKWEWFEKRTDLIVNRQKRVGDIERLLEKPFDAPTVQDDSGNLVRVPETAREQFERQLGVPIDVEGQSALEEKLLEEIMLQTENMQSSVVLENRPLFRETALQEFKSPSDEAYDRYIEKRGYGYYSRPSHLDADAEAVSTKERKLKTFNLPKYETEEEKRANIVEDLIRLHHKHRHKRHVGHHNRMIQTQSKYINTRDIAEMMRMMEEQEGATTASEAAAAQEEEKEIMQAARESLGPTIARMIENIPEMSNEDYYMNMLGEWYRDNGLTDPKMEKLEFYSARKDFVINKFTQPVSDVFEHLFAPEAPEKIEEHDATKMMVFDVADYDKIFAGGIGGDLNEAFEMLYHRGIMIREPVYPILNHIQRVKEHISGEQPLAHDDPANARGHVLVGARGSGKSACLAAAVAHAHKNGFLVFYIPSAHYWTHGAHFIEPSTVLEGYFDAPVATEEFAKGFLHQNEEILKNMPLSRDYDLPVEPGQKQPTNLYELVSFGLVSYNNMSISFKILLDELSMNKNVPMFFAVDDYNFFMDNTGFKFGNIYEFATTMPKKVHAREFLLVRGLNKMMLQNNPNHVFACAYSNKWKTESPQPYTKNVLDVVHVPRYNYEELRTILDYYQSIHHICPEFDNFINDVAYVSGAVPGQVFYEMQFI